MSDLEINWLICIVVSKSQSRKLMAALYNQHFNFTVIDSSSFFLEPTECLLIGLNKSRLDELDGLVRSTCQPYKKYLPSPLHGRREISHIPPLESHQGGATLFGMPIEYFEQF